MSEVNNRDGAADKTFVFDHKKEYLCKLCNVKCSGVISYKTHIEGRQHYRTLARLDAVERNSNSEPSSMGPPNPKKLKLSDSVEPFLCKLCEVNCSGPESYAAHMKGSKHSKKMKETQLEKAIDKEGIKTLENGLGFECTLCSVTMSTKCVVDSHVNGAKHRRHINNDTPTSNVANLQFECKCCKVFLNTQAQLDIHSQSPRHKRKEEAYNNLAMVEEALKKAENGGQTDGKQFDAWDPSC